MSNEIGKWLDSFSKKDEVENEEKEQEVKAEDVQTEINETVVEENTETPQAEAVTEETTVDEVVSEESVEVETEEFDFFKLASEKLGREVKSLDDLVIKEEVEKQVDYASDFSREYDKFYKETGGGVKEFEFVQQDLTEKPKEEIVKEILRKKNPFASKKQLDILYETKYVFDEEDDTERDIELKKLAFEQDYHEGLREMQNLQEKYKLPQQKPESTNQEELLKQQQEAFEQQKLAWAKAVEVSNKELKGIKIKIGDSEITHNIPDDKRVAVRDITADASMQKYLQKYVDASGNYDTLSIQRDAYIRDNLDSIIKDVIKSTEASVVERLAREDKSINFSSDVKQKVDTPADARRKAEEELMKSIYGIKK